MEIRRAALVGLATFGLVIGGNAAANAVTPLPAKLMACGPGDSTPANPCREVPICAPGQVSKPQPPSAECVQTHRVQSTPGADCNVGCGTTNGISYEETMSRARPLSV